MIKTSKGIFIIIIIFSALLTLGCKKKSNIIQATTYIDDERSGSQIILGFSQIGTESAWRINNTKSIFNAAAEEGVQILFDDAQQKQTNQLKAIRSFIVYRVDVIAFVPIVETGWDNVLQEAKEARIPVIIVDRKIKTSDETLYAGFIGENGIDEGKKAAKFILQKYADKQNKTFNILEISGTENSSMAKERSQGFREALNTNHNFKIIYSKSGDFLRSRGKEIINSILLQNKSLIINAKPIDIIYSHNDAMTLGILEALYNHNIQAGKDVTIVSIDGEQQAIEALKNGKINCIVECNPMLGPDLIKLVKTAANKNTIPRVTYIEEKVFTEEDIFDTTEIHGF